MDPAGAQLSLPHDLTSPLAHLLVRYAATTIRVLAASFRHRSDELARKTPALAFEILGEEAIAQLPHLDPCFPCL
jgi:hypothetical protein